MLSREIQIGNFIQYSAIENQSYYQSLFPLNDRLKTATSKFVTIFNVCVVVGPCLCGALTGIFGLKIVQRINSKLREVNDVAFGNSQKTILENLIHFRLIKSWKCLTMMSEIRNGIFL